MAITWLHILNPMEPFTMANNITNVSMDHLTSAAQVLYLSIWQETLRGKSVLRPSPMGKLCLVCLHYPFLVPVGLWLTHSLTLGGNNREKSRRTDNSLKVIFILFHLFFSYIWFDAILSIQGLTLVLYKPLYHGPCKIQGFSII